MENKIESMADTAVDSAQGFDELLKNREFQSEFDRRISRALDTARSKWMQETGRRIEQVRMEERSSSDERISAEYAEREAELHRRENLLIERELRADAVKMLNERGLPPELIGAINLSGEENMKASMENAELAFRKAVQSGVEQRMRGSTPISANRTAGKDMGDAEYYRSRYPGTFNG